ncbi:centromere protein X isoform 13 [Mus musculus]|uniref:centromere protein X isoform 13 n=1 Tax=Mus musculus TaxID=10090 RepID=UPI00299D64C5|nr:centromere protein X isoform 13 [Mus musculus]
MCYRVFGGGLAAGWEQPARSAAGLSGQRGCTAAHGGVPEDLRTRGCCPWGLAGPGRRPGCCGSGSAGESAPSAAPGLLEFPPVACKV